VGGAVPEVDGYLLPRLDPGGGQVALHGRLVGARPVELGPLGLVGGEGRGQHGGQGLGAALEHLPHHRLPVDGGGHRPSQVHVVPRLGGDVEDHVADAGAVPLYQPKPLAIGEEGVLVGLEGAEGDVDFPLLEGELEGR
jgi:hypothetical protein